MTNKEVAEKVTSRILEALEGGTVPWHQPWRGGIPMSFSTRKAYRGFNAFLLGMGGYGSPWFLTFNQVKAQNGHVKKGEKGWPIVLWKWIEVEDENDPELDPRTVPFIRYYTVFNLEQCTGVDPPVKEQETEIDPIKHCDKLIKNMPKRPPIKHDGGSRAFYRPATDSIHLPAKKKFYDTERYYSTLFHELGHATGHTSRLGRKGIEEPTWKGSYAYSHEELIAELSAAMLCNITGIENKQTVDNTNAYIKSWLQILSDDRMLLIVAGQQAQRAVDFIMDSTPAQVEEAA